MRQLAKMNVEDLIALSAAVQTELEQRREQIQRNLDALVGSDGQHPRRVSLKGRKVPPKYRGPNGETWAGRGVTPRWLVALLKKGRKLETYRIKGT